MKPNTRIIVGGDRLVSGYRLPAYSLSVNDVEKLKDSEKRGTQREFWNDLKPGRENWFFLRGGADVLLNTINGMVHGSAQVILEEQHPGNNQPFVCVNTVETMHKLIRITDRKNPENFVIRFAEHEDVVVQSGWSFKKEAKKKQERSDAGDILVHWVCPMEELERLDKEQRINIGFPDNPPSCSIHIQIGALNGDEKRIWIEDDEDKESCSPNCLATPDVARIIVTNLDEICPHARIRRALSYDSIVVDLLRTGRGYEESPNLTKKFARLTGIKSKDKYPTYVVVRINSTAILLYKYQLFDDRKEAEEDAWLFFYKDRPAPIMDPDKGVMLGYNMLIGAVIAEKVRNSDAGNLDDNIHTALKRAVRVQDAHFKGGLQGTLRRKPSGTGFIDPNDIKKFSADLLNLVQKNEAEEEAKAKAKEEANELGDVITVRIDIQTAVARHSQWFIVKDHFKGGIDKTKADMEPYRDTKPRTQIEEFFSETIANWLTKGPFDLKSRIPMVMLGDRLRLVDRREIEDFLSLRTVLLHYADRSRQDESRSPLNLAVFGPPGSGKSTGIKQIAVDIKETGRYAEKILEFNLSQFINLDDYASAFQQVRDRCLEGKVPIVFFDEFDSTFQGIPFGWLKYFLAPMQDGEFTHRGCTYKLGRCVLVFAGAINRSFEEFSGRGRNPSFIEAKGPDFMSRLRDHINVRGINRPHDDGLEQGRYLLRRGVILHSMMVHRLARKEIKMLPPRGLLHPDVARAFCKIDRFRHEVRSMEAILEMCNLRRGETLGPSDLPPLDQLNMHVDGPAFLDLVLKNS